MSTTHRPSGGTSSELVDATCKRLLHQELRRQATPSKTVLTTWVRESLPQLDQMVVARRVSSFIASADPAEFLVEVCEHTEHLEGFPRPTAIVSRFRHPQATHSDVHDLFDPLRELGTPRERGLQAERFVESVLDVHCDEDWEVEVIAPQKGVGDLSVTDRFGRTVVTEVKNQRSHWDRPPSRRELAARHGPHSAVLILVMGQATDRCRDRLGKLGCRFTELGLYVVGDSKGVDIVHTTGVTPWTPVTVQSAPKEATQAILRAVRGIMADLPPVHRCARIVPPAERPNETALERAIQRQNEGWAGLSRSTRKRDERLIRESGGDHPSA